MKPESACDYFLFPLTLSMYVFIFLVSLVGGIGICGLRCMGFGTCWGKKFLKKMARKYNIPVDEEMGTEPRDACNMKDGFVIVEMPK